MSVPNAPSQGVLSGPIAFANTDMMSIEHIDNPPPKLSAIDAIGVVIPLHPLMQKAHDDLHTRYQRFALEQSIRLASRILSSDVLHPFFNTFTTLPTAWASGTAAGVQYTASRVNYNRSISAHERATVDSLLASLAKNLSFHIDRPKQRDNESHHTNVTQDAVSLSPLPIPPSHILPALHGRKSEIYINGKAVDNLFSVYSDTNTNHVKRYVRHIFQLRLLQHEEIYTPSDL